MTWLAIVNTQAGRGNHNEARTRKALAANQIEAEVVATRSAPEATGVVSQAIQQGTNKFLAVGGDGTVNVVVNAIMAKRWSTPPWLGVLPAGTGCDFLRVFGIPQNIELAARRLTGDETYAVDVGWLEGSWGRRWFLNVAQAGIGGASARLASRFSFLGRARYTAAFWAALPRFASSQMEMRVGEAEVSGRGVAAIFANGQFFGGGLNIAPRASVIDGLVDVQVFFAKKLEALSIFPKVAKGTHEPHPAVRRLQGSSFELSCDRPWPVEVDGEYLGETPLTGGIHKAAIALKI